MNMSHLIQIAVGEKYMMSANVENRRLVNKIKRQCMHAYSFVQINDFFPLFRNKMWFDLIVIQEKMTQFKSEQWKNEERKEKLLNIK